jgi:glycogen debranching enzyme
LRKNITDIDLLISECRQVLNSNLPDQDILEKLPFRYTCPAKEKGIYLPQWLWDSCFHAIVYRWFDPKMAWDELQSLIVHQVKTGDDAGMIPHMAYLNENKDIKDQEIFQHQERSIITQPPLIAIASLEVNRIDPNTEILQRIFDALVEHHNWFDRRRDPEGENLVAILHPWESGWDVSQRWDNLMGFNGYESGLLNSLASRRLELVKLLIEYNCDATKIVNLPNGFYVKPTDFNAIRAADLDALAVIGKIIGKSEAECLILKRRASKIREVIQKKMIRIVDEKVLAHDLSEKTFKNNFQDSATKFVLLFGKCVTTKQAELLIKELFEKGGHFHTPYLVPTTPTSALNFNGSEYWRGNVWLPVNWLIFKGLILYDFRDEAQKLVQNNIELVTDNGYCEFYNPITGERGKASGIDCPKNQSWSTIILDMLMTSVSSGT